MSKSREGGFFVAACDVSIEKRERLYECLKREFSIVLRIATAVILYCVIFNKKERKIGKSCTCTFSSKSRNLLTFNTTSTFDVHRGKSN